MHEESNLDPRRQGSDARKEAGDAKVYMLMDSFLKFIFSLPEVVADYIAGFVEEPWARLVDRSTLVPEETRRVGSDLRQRESDRVWSVRCPGEDHPSVCLIFEFQSKSDRRMPLRMGIYAMRQLEGLLREDRLPDGRLPLVHSAVVYTGDGPWTAGLSTSEITLDLGGASWDVPNVEYRLLAAGEVDIDRAGLQGNSAAAILRLLWNRLTSRWRKLAAVAMDAIAGREASDVRCNCLLFLEAWVPQRFKGEQVWDLSRLEGEEHERWAKMKDELNVFTQRFIREGIQKGRQAGRQEGRQEGLDLGWKQGLEEGLKRGLDDRRQLLFRLACKRFDDVPAASLSILLDRIRDSAGLDEVGDWILSCESGPDFLGRFNGAGG